MLETHGLDMASILADANLDKKKRIPSLVKITDLKKSESPGEYIWIMLL